MPYIARVRVTLKPAVNDPQGITIARALKSLGFEGVQSVRAGKYLELRLADDDATAAEERVRTMCQKLLANPVTETFSFDLEQI
ncbi:MAG: phosphoribosylformylglycinamidine synthase subunit PurS [Chloroflexi bacterium]|nr:phosphoribosylformylglycinamidine synthase subunit PurS [Chloroflexota bacterium]